MKKLNSQMNDEERALIHGYLRTQVGQLRGSSHFHDRASERTFSLSEAIEAVRTGRVIEVNDNPGYRALVRSLNGTCVVVELTHLRVITVYYNDQSDTHSTLDRSKYTWKQDIVELVKQLRKKVLG